MFKNFRIKWNLTMGYVMAGSAIMGFITGHYVLGLALLAGAIHAFYTQWREDRFTRLLRTVEDILEEGDEIDMVEVLGKMYRGEIRRANRRLGLFDTAIASGWKSVGRLLLQNCPLPAGRTAGGNTALHILMAFNDTNISWLSHQLIRTTLRAMKYAVDINARNGEGQTPLDVCVMFDNTLWRNDLIARKGVQAMQLPEESDFAGKSSKKQ